MREKLELSPAYRLLEQNTFQNLVTPKMLNSYSQHMELHLRQDGNNWALLSILPVDASDWDRRVYPTAKYVVLLNGNNDNLTNELLGQLPDGPFVAKLGDKKVIEYFLTERKAINLTSFHSFTSNKPLKIAAQLANAYRSRIYNEEAWEFFGENGYTPEELDRSFRNGAQWFGVSMGTDLASACLVYQNYKDIWEIGGVYTKPDFRKKGLGKSVVVAALGYLEQERRIPRYQVRGDNHNSLRLAHSCGLREFLRIDHLAVGFDLKEEST